MSSIEPVSSVDSAWLAMENPSNLMMVTGVITFKGRMDLEALRHLLLRRFVIFKRFRQRVVHPHLPLAPTNWTPSFWETDPEFNIDAHIHEIQLDPPANRRVVRDVVGRLMSTPLSFDRPLWEMHLIQGWGDGTILVARIHHCIADGVALIRLVLNSMADETPDAPEPELQDTDAQAAPSTSLIEEAIDTVVQHATAAMTTMVKFYSKVMMEVMEALSSPAKAMELARTGSEGAQTISRLLMRADDPKTLFKGPLGVEKKVAWTTPFPLEEVKSIKSALGGTVNDVLISAITGGLHRYLIRHHTSAEGLNFRAAIPVNLRRSDDYTKMGNKFGLVFLSLPVGIEDPVERLHEVHHRMDALKNSQEAPLFFGLLKSLGYTPVELQSSVVSAFAQKVTAVMSNVPGPGRPLYMKGREIDNLMFWVPQSGRVGLGISILSYNNKVLIGVNTDAGLVPDPEQVIDGFYQEFELLRKRSKQADRPPRVAKTGAAAAGALDRESAEPEHGEVAPQTEAQCKATTRKGTRCRRPAIEGSDYCRMHQKQDAALEEPPAKPTAAPAEEPAPAAETGD